MLIDVMTFFTTAIFLITVTFTFVEEFAGCLSTINENSSQFRTSVIWRRYSAMNWEQWLLGKITHLFEVDHADSFQKASSLEWMALHRQLNQHRTLRSTPQVAENNWYRSEWTYRRAIKAGKSVVIHHRRLKGDKWSMGERAERGALCIVEW